MKKEKGKMDFTYFIRIIPFYIFHFYLFPFPFKAIIPFLYFQFYLFLFTS